LALISRPLAILFLIRPVVYSEVNEVGNLLEKFDSFIQSDVRVNSTLRYTLQFEISANALEIRVVQNPKCKV
jgi:hypothetical protein